jgi:hypothetical protein
MEHGILNDYQEMYISWREFKLSKIHFGKNAANLEENILKEDSYDFMDEPEEELVQVDEEYFSYTLDEQEDE